MFIGLLQKWALQIIAGSVILLLAVSAYAYVKYQANKIDSLEFENYALSEQNEEFRASMDMLYGRIAKQSKLNSELESKMRESEAKREELLDKFRRHKLKDLAEAKPEWIERIINNGTNKVFNDIESITTP